MTLDLKALREIAEKATPGPWRWRPMYEGQPQAETDLLDSNDERIIQTDSGFYPPRNNDRDYIAAFDPPTTLALLDLIEEKDREIADAKAKWSEQYLQNVNLRECTIHCLETDLAAAQAEIDALKCNNLKLQDNCVAMRDEKDAEIKRLREALGEIDKLKVAFNTASIAQEIARAALAQEKETL